ncbi:MAG: trypsin-like serine protease, partial [Planctomycetaceae bacterium]|nr:trypsin-like serine protease [Planctomycetaceae bacterium]
MNFYEINHLQFLESRVLLSGDSGLDTKDPVDFPDLRSIVNIGSDASYPANFYPAVGLLRNSTGQNVPGHCTGTLITPQHVLTAAHCLDADRNGTVSQAEINAAVANLYFTTDYGANVVGSTAQNFKVTAAFVHSGFQVRRNTAGDFIDTVNDLAILRLDRIATNIVPIKLFRSAVPVDSVVRLIGFGQSGNTAGGVASSNGRVRYHGVARIDTATSINPNQYNPATYSHALDEKNESQSRPGDSGSPVLVYQNGSDEPFLAGVLSYGQSGPEPDRNEIRIGQRSWDTRVDLYLNWIDGILAQNPPQSNVEIVSQSNITTPQGSSTQIRIRYSSPNGQFTSGFPTPKIAAIGPNNYVNTNPRIGLVIRAADGTTLTVDYGFDGPGGVWNANDNGSYQFVTLNNQLPSDFPNQSGYTQLGTFTVNVPVDSQIPAASGTLPDLTRGGAPEQNIRVIYSDNFGIDASTLGNNDVVIRKTDGTFLTSANLLGDNTRRDAGTIQALYTFTPPGGTWDSSDNGTYQIIVRGNSISDTSGHFVNQTTIDTFSVNIPAGSLHPYARLLTQQITSQTRYIDFEVVYTGYSNIDVSSISANNPPFGAILVEPSQGLAEVASWVSSTPGSNATTVTARYRVDFVKTWTAADNGIVLNLQLFSDSVRDVDSRDVPGTRLGTIKINIGGGNDTVRPTAVASVSNVNLSGSERHLFQVAYADNEAIESTTINSSNLVVVGPDQQVYPVGQSGVNFGENFATKIAGYGLDAPGGSWGAEDNGMYRLFLLDGTVSDINGNFVPGASSDLNPNDALAEFMVNIDPAPLTPPITATVIAPDLTISNQQYYQFQVRYRSNAGIDPAVFGDNDIIVTNNNGYLEFAKFVAVANGYSTGTSKTVTYRIAAPIDFWNTSHDGAYEIHFAGGEIPTVVDLSGNELSAGLGGQFNININTTPLNSTLSSFVGLVNGNWWQSFPTASHIFPEAQSTKSPASMIRLSKVGDFNGDGFDDLAVWLNNGDWYVGQSDQQGGLNFALWTQWRTNDVKEIHVGDFNNDGKDDLIGLFKSGTRGRWWVSISDGGRFSGVHWGDYGKYHGIHSVHVANFDGVKGDDLAIIADSGVVWMVKTSNHRFQYLNSHRWDITHGFDYVQVGDFNGDGRGDLLAVFGTGV